MFAITTTPSANQSIGILRRPRAMPVFGVLVGSHGLHKDREWTSRALGEDPISLGHCRGLPHLSEPSKILDLPYTYLTKAPLWHFAPAAPSGNAKFRSCLAMPDRPFGDLRQEKAQFIPLAHGWRSQICVNVGSGLLLVA